MSDEIRRLRASKAPEPVKKRRGLKPEPLGPVSLHLLDSPKNDLAGQFLKTLRKAITARAHYDKRYRKAPWAGV